MGLIKTSSLCLLLLAVSVTLNAQTDTVTSHGDFSGEWRNFYMATVNKGDLKNWQALATGGFLKYVYNLKSHWEFGAAVNATFNLNITDVAAKDSTTGAGSRYESGLFDVNDLDDRTIVLLGELFVRYKWKNNSITVGRTRIKTSFINGQDGRMIPTMVEGINFNSHTNPVISYELGVFNRIAPRSTGRFYQIGQSIGQYAVGRNPDGTPSGYKDNTSSRFIAIGYIHWRPLPHFNLEVTEYFIDQVFNTVHIVPQYHWQNENNRTFSIRGEWVAQQRIGHGGNENEDLRYFSDPSANVFGIQLGTRRNSGWRFSYNRITGDGRFLFPREWGREFLFGFQKRERSEGNGNTNALMLAATNAFTAGKTTVDTEFSIAHHWRTDPADPALNKYAFPSYTHINADIFLNHSAIPNLRPEFLVTYKFSPDILTDYPGYVINKVDMWQINLVINYSFN